MDIYGVSSGYEYLPTPDAHGSTIGQSKSAMQQNATKCTRSGLVPHLTLDRAKVHCSNATAPHMATCYIFDHCVLCSSKSTFSLFVAFVAQHGDYWNGIKGGPGGNPKPGRRKAAIRILVVSFTIVAVFHSVSNYCRGPQQQSSIILPLLNSQSNAPIQRHISQEVPTDFRPCCQSGAIVSFPRALTR